MATAPDSPHASAFDPGLGFRQSKLVARGGPVRAVIVQIGRAHV